MIRVLGTTVDIFGAKWVDKNGIRKRDYCVDGLCWCPSNLAWPRPAWSRPFFSFHETLHKSQSINDKCQANPKRPLATRTRSCVDESQNMISIWVFRNARRASAQFYNQNSFDLLSVLRFPIGYTRFADLAMESKKYTKAFVGLTCT